MKTDILLHEHGAPIVARLTDREATALQECSARIDVRLTRTAGLFELRASQFVGTVVLPGRVVRIRPKVNVDRLMFLLGFTPESMAFAGHTRAAETDDLVVAMKSVYAHALGHLLERGLLREYCVQEDDLVGVRGRIDPKAVVMRRHGLFPPIRCSFQEYTVDQEANRRLFAAAVKLARAGDRRDNASRRLFRLEQRFEGVQLVRYEPDRVSPLPRNRSLGPYEPALSIAEAVLRNASVEPTAGPAGTVGFVVDMNKVYERFVARALRCEMRLDARTWQEQAAGLYIDEAKRLPMQPDVLWRSDDGSPAIVVDTKYKSVDRVVREDVHQVVTYCTALGIRHAVLLYANCRQETHVVRTAGVRVHAWSLRIDGTIADVQDEVARVARLLRSLRADAALTSWCTCLRAALRSAYGAEKVEKEVSAFHVADQTRTPWRGLHVLLIAAG